MLPLSQEIASYKSFVIAIESICLVLLLGCWLYLNIKTFKHSQSVALALVHVSVCLDILLIIFHLYWHSNNASQECHEMVFITRYFIALMYATVCICMCERLICGCDEISRVCWHRLARHPHKQSSTSMEDPQSCRTIWSSVFFLVMGLFSIIVPGLNTRISLEEGCHVRLPARSAVLGLWWILTFLSLVSAIVYPVITYGMCCFPSENEIEMTDILSSDCSVVESSNDSQPSLPGTSIDGGAGDGKLSVSHRNMNKKPSMDSSALPPLGLHRSSSYSQHPGRLPKSDSKNGNLSHLSRVHEGKEPTEIPRRGGALAHELLFSQGTLGHRASKSQPARKLKSIKSVQDASILYPIVVCFIISSWIPYIFSLMQTPTLGLLSVSIVFTVVRQVVLSLSLIFIARKVQQQAQKASAHFDSGLPQFQSPIDSPPEQHPL